MKEGRNDESIFRAIFDVICYRGIGRLSGRAWDGKGADGQHLPEGVYFFVFKAEGVDGHYYEKKGSVTLLR